MEGSQISHEPGSKKQAFFKKGLKSLVPLRGGFLKQARVQVDFRLGQFHVKTANTYLERRAALKLRYQIFHGEFCGNNVQQGVDKDRFDDIADILIIKCIKNNEIVGTYRLICSDVSDTFYSATEFSAHQFFRTSALKVELSRACIHPKYRKGSVITLLWRGLSEYLEATGARYLFGLSSLTKVSPKEVLGIIAYLRAGEMLDDSWGVLPLPKYDRSSHILSELIHPESTAVADQKLMIPPLFKAYLNAGAKVATVPAYDVNFHCYDFFTCLDVEKLSSLHRNKFIKS